MKVRFVLATLLGMAMVASELPTIAVIDITGARAEGAGQSSYYRFHDVEDRVIQRATMALVHSKRFQVLDRAHLDKLLSEARFSNGVFADTSPAIALGKQLGAQYIVTGSYTLGQRVDLPTVPTGVRAEPTYITHLALSLCFVNTETGVICDAAEVVTEGRSQDATMDAVLVNLSRSLDEAMPTMMANVNLIQTK